MYYNADFVATSMGVERQTSLKIFLHNSAWHCWKWNRKERVWGSGTTWAKHNLIGAA